LSGLAIASNAMRLFAPLLARLFFIAEPLAPRVISYYIKRFLRDWKNNNVILDYRTRARRLRKFHYTIVVDLYLTSEQACEILRNGLF
jgi:hypothetical protein